MNDENTQSTFTKTKNLLDEMIFKKKQKITSSGPNLDEIIKGLWRKRNGYNEKTKELREC